MKFEQIRAVQDFLQFESILDSGIIKMKDYSYVLIVEVKPINYNLKSELEKSNILNSYKMLFQNYNLNLQILIRTKKEDIKKHITMIKNLNLYPSLTEQYISFITSLNSNEKSSEKVFFISIKSTSQDELKSNYIKIKEGLLRCGNIVSKLTKEEVESIFSNF